MNDRMFLSWLHDRLVHVHGENAQTDYMGKLRSIIDALPPEQETPNAAPDLESLRLAHAVLTLDIGEIVEAGGRRWILCAEVVDSPTDVFALTRQVYFTDAASPSAFVDLDPGKDYSHQVWHIRTPSKISGGQGGAMMSRGSWAKQFRSGEYVFDPAVVNNHG